MYQYGFILENIFTIYMACDEDIQVLQACIWESWKYIGVLSIHFMSQVGTVI